MRLTILLLILFTLPWLSSAQNKERDSLEVRVVLMEEQERIPTYLRLAELYLPYEAEKSLGAAEKALKLAEQFDEPKLIARALVAKGKAIQFQLSDYELALQYCLEALRIQENEKDIRGQLHTLKNISEIFEAVGQPSKALRYYLDIRSLEDSLGKSNPESFLSIARLYGELGQASRSMEFIQWGREEATKQGNAEVLIQLILENARQLQRLGDTEAAKENFQNALELSREHLYAPTEVKALMGLGNLANLSKDWKGAMAQYEKALGITQKEKMFAEQTQIKVKLGNLNTLLGKEEEAQKLLNEALQEAIQINDKYLIRDCYEYLYTFHSRFENYRQASEYKDLYVDINEFIYLEEGGQRVTDMENQLQMEKKESEIELLRQNQLISDLRIQNQQKNFGILLVAALLILVLFMGGLFLYRNKQKAAKELAFINQQIRDQKTELENLNQTKDKFFSIIAHDLKGPLNSLTSFSSLLMNHTDSMSKEEIKMLATDLDKSLKNLFSLLENLLEWARSQTGSIQFNPIHLSIHELSEGTIQVLEASAAKKKITLASQVPKELQAFGDKNLINTVIRNLVSNAIKFTPEEGQITIKGEEWKDAVEVSIVDNGVGMNPDIQKNLFRLDKKTSTKGTNNEKGTGLGLILCKEFVEKNGGEIMVSSEESKGTTISFTLPKNGSAASDTSD